jgi:DNA-binding transcriptional MerR regulator
MRNLDIAEVVERSGLPASALRFYEQKGLIRSTGRRGLRRVFPAGVVEKLALIALGRSAGFRSKRSRRCSRRTGACASIAPSWRQRRTSSMRRFGS